ncbi:MAG: efflux RND transporter periplasmic adaptor subunit [Bacteroidales bacterium]|nr:efflux RND transporter periplasmic adaptor subunit [Bacteroidales bacterium]
MKKLKLILILLLLAAVGVAVYFIFFSENKNSVVVVSAQPATMGSIANVVTATGTIEPIQQVEVGTQVSGEVKKVYVDYNSQVKAGQLIAELDKTNLKVSVSEAQISYEKALNELNYIKKNYERQKSLYADKLISEADFDEISYKYNNAKSSLTQSKASLDKAKTNLGYADIYSPVDGVVLSKSIEEGQTVAASFNTPTLFTIAQDLTKMQVEADIDEADIGQIKVGQRVTFTVDAFQNDVFNGKVVQVRLDPKVTSNVVTYTVIIEADNPDLKLMPGLTATVSIYTLEISNVLTIPESALNYRIDFELLEKYYAQNGVKMERPEMPKDSASFKKRSKGEKPDKRSNFVWVISNKKLERKPVTIGESDEINYQVVSGLSENDSVVTSLKSVTKKDLAQAKSPFMQQRPNRGGGNRGGAPAGGKR